MRVSEALEILGTRRVIWIDDCFNDTPNQLADLLTNSIETSIACGFPELQRALESYEYDPDAAHAEIVQSLTDLDADRFNEIKMSFFAMEGTAREFATGELSQTAVEAVCELLGVSADDRWTFDRADRDLPDVRAAGDAEVSYVVDLNEAGGSPTRGLEVLKTLWESGSSGTAFILTHETNIAGESESEDALRQQSELEGIGLPICVIAKERLYDNETDPNSMEEALKIAVKRAGLRRSVHEVLRSVDGKLKEAFNDAATGLLSVAPEHLEKHVVERGYREGVSELHVVERALTAHMGRQIRQFFGCDPGVHSSVKRLRDLRAIELSQIASTPDANLTRFRTAEVWESDELLNSALTPIACGDVFEADSQEPATRTSTKRFILLAQPCDISLRPGQKRQQDTAFFVPLKKPQNAEKNDPKAPLLPFKLDDSHWACDFRQATIVNLSILDLASFRPDGRVRVDDGHKKPDDLLVGQQNIYESRTSIVSGALSGATPLPVAGVISIPLQLTFATGESFKHIHKPTLAQATKLRVDGKQVSLPKRVTWCLRRCGRVRMPYAAALLEQYTSVMSRHAFELDYMAEPEMATGQSEAAGLPDPRPVAEAENAVTVAPPRENTPENAVAAD